MSANPGRLPTSGSGWLPHFDDAGIEWRTYEALATQEKGSETPLTFTDDSKQKIADAIYMFRASKVPHKVGDIKTLAGQIYKIVNDAPPDQNLLAGHGDWTPSEYLCRQDGFDKDVFEFMMAHTLDEAAAGKSVKQRINDYRRNFRTFSADFTIKGPRPEAMAVHLIRDQFRVSEMRAKVTHTRPSSVEPGNEKLSAFESLVFKHVLPEIGSDDAARAILKRRLEEAERALDR